jgi:hypothetical protein
LSVVFQEQVEHAGGDDTGNVEVNRDPILNGAERGTYPWIVECQSASSVRYLSILKFTVDSDLGTFLPNCIQMCL